MITIEAIIIPAWFVYLLAFLAVLMIANAVLDIVSAGLRVTIWAMKKRLGRKPR